MYKQKKWTIGLALVMALGLMMGCNNTVPESDPAPSDIVDGPAPGPGGDRQVIPIDFVFEGSLTQPLPADEWEDTNASDTHEAMMSFTDAYKAFSYSSAGKLFAEDEAGTNALYSPASLYMAMGMLAESTAGDTRDEVIAALGMQDFTDLGPYSDRMFQMLYSDFSPAEVFMSNSIWFDAEQVDPTPELLNALERNYHAYAFSVDFADPATGKLYTDWINRATRGMLEGSPPPDTVACILLNTLYFESSWTKTFDPAQTRADTFTATGGDEMTADFMVKDRGWRTYTLGDDFVRTALDFVGGYQMHFILPNEGTTPEALLADPSFKARVFDAESALGDVYLEVPKFDFKADYELTDFVKAMGVEKAMVPGGDFSPLRGMELYIDQIIQKTAVSVDENGCKAAAYTEMMIATGGAPDPAEIKEIDVVLNRPFIFAITGNYGVPLFIGIVNNPTVA